MRTAKPKVKREIKVNKKKEIPIKKVKFIDEDIEKRKFLLESIYRIYENSQRYMDKGNKTKQWISQSVLQNVDGKNY